MKDYFSEIDAAQQLLDSMDMVKDIDETTKMLNARVRDIIQEVLSKKITPDEVYVCELETISKNLQALAEYRGKICVVR